MRRETDTFLNLVRDAQDPTPADEARVLLALRATLVAGAATSAVASATLEQMRRAEPSAFAALGSKLTVALVCTLAASFMTGDTRRAVPDVEARAGLTARDDAAVAAAPERLDLAGGGAAREPPAPLPEMDAASKRSDPARSDPVRSESRLLDRRPARRATSAPAHREPTSLRAELELLSRVQELLRQGDAAGALRTLDAHRTQDRVLLAERRAARILALCGVGREGEARAAAAAFATEHPDSVQRATIASSCANSRWIGKPPAVIGQ